MRGFRPALQGYHGVAAGRPRSRMMAGTAFVCQWRTVASGRHQRGCSAPRTIREQDSISVSRPRPKGVLRPHPLDSRPHGDTRLRGLAAATPGQAPLDIPEGHGEAQRSRMSKTADGRTSMSGQRGCRGCDATLCHIAGCAKRGQRNARRRRKRLCRGFQGLGAFRPPRRGL